MLKSVFQYAKPGFLPRQLFLISAEQSAVAASTLCLALAAKNLQDQRWFLIYLGAFIGLSQLPHLFLIFIRRFEMRGYVEMYGGFLQQRLFAPGARPGAWANYGQREKFLTAIGSEADSYISAVAFCYFDIFSYILSIVLNTLALSAAIESDFIWAFTTSLILSFLVYRTRKTQIEKAVEQEQASKLDLASYVLKAWDNVLLKNPSISRRYQNLLDQRLLTTGTLAAKSATQTLLAIFLVSLSAAVPVLGLNVWTALKNPDNLALLAALMITLPRQVAILGTYRSLFTQFAYLKLFSIRLRTAIENSELQELNLEDQMTFSKLNLSNVTATSFHDLLQHLERNAHGRILVSGPNGAGKSSLLLALNRALPQSFYLPAAASLEIGEDVDQGSTGQRMLSHLRYVVNLKVPVLLLDEWDANLDVANKELISKEIDLLAQSRLVIEIRH